MKRLSVIIPGYNTPKAWWQRCVASVQAAIGPDDEIIVIDDGSTVPVETNWFCGEIKVARRENGGLSRARNTALEIAQGEYITFVDSDDEILPKTFERCLTSLNSTNADVAIYGVRTIWPSEGLEKSDVATDKSYGQLSAQNVLDLVNVRLFNYACNKVYRRSFLDAHSLRFDPDGMPYEDIIFNLNCVMAGANWCMVNYVGYVYYRTGLTLLSTYKPSNRKGTLLANDTWIKYKKSVPDGYDVFGLFGESNESSLLCAEWTNLWKPRSPFGWRQKREWMKKNYEKIGCTRSVTFIMLQKALFVFLRRHCYIRLIRRWNIKRQYPHAVDIKVCVRHSSTSTSNIDSSL